MSPTNPARPSHADFTLPDFTWLRTEMSAEQKDELVQLINHYPVVVDDPARDGAWVSYSVEYHGARRSQNAPSWMTNKYDLWFRHPLVILEKQLACPDFDGSMDFVPFRESTPDGKRLYTDFMSANWAWDQADVLSRNPKFKGAMFAPVIVGRGESAVSLDSASQNEFYPLYISLGNIQGVVRCSHHDPMSLIGLLAIPKANREYHSDGSTYFEPFRPQLFRLSLRRIVSFLGEHLLKIKVTRCCDGHFRRVVYAVGPYILDYPDSVPSGQAELDSGELEGGEKVGLEET